MAKRKPRVVVPPKYGPNGEKRPGPRKLFVQRMKREGRHDEWSERLKRYTDSGMGWSPAAWKVAREMGYESAAAEWYKYEQHLEEERKKLLAETNEGVDLLVQEHRAKKLEEEERKKGERAFLDAIKDLPATASGRDELNWLRAHPAIVRQQELTDKGKEVVITPDDVLCPGHGPAPSKAAAWSLKHYANQPNKLHDKILALQAKGYFDEVSEESDGVYKDDMGELEELLSAFHDE